MGSGLSGGPFVCDVTNAHLYAGNYSSEGANAPRSQKNYSIRWIIVIVYYANLKTSKSGKSNVRLMRKYMISKANATNEIDNPMPKMITGISMCSNESAEYGESPDDPWFCKYLAADRRYSYST